jgi:hypothetical protein
MYNSVCGDQQQGNEMNGRLQELAAQAGLNPALMLNHWGTIDALTDSERESLARIEKFAELLMLACSNNLSFHGHIEASEQVEWFKRKLLQKNNSNNG